MGKDKRGERDKTGPHKDSHMSKVLGRKGKMSGRRQGPCEEDEKDSD